jgi:predicted transcriptional regulator
MEDRFQDVTDAELAVLQILWRSGGANVRQLTDELYPDGSEASYQTVKKLLERLEGKDCVRRDRDNPVHVFEPCIAREDLIGHRLRAVATSLCEGSLTPLLTHLVSCSDISANDLRSLHSLIEELNSHGG